MVSILVDILQWVFCEGLSIIFVGYILLPFHRWCQGGPRKRGIAHRSTRAIQTMSILATVLGSLIFASDNLMV